MDKIVTVFAPVTLAKGISEAELLKASEKFQTEFVSKESGVLRRELVRKADGTYVDIVQFRSKEDFEAVSKKEMESPICMEFFSLMDMQAMEGAEMEVMPSLATYG
jgi:hypothetical protein